MKRIKQWIFNWKIKHGLAVLGRQHDVKSKMKGTLSIRVIRKDGTIEDHGVVAELK